MQRGRSAAQPSASALLPLVLASSYAQLAQPVRAAPPATSRPNLLYIIADDIGFGDFKPWNNESRIQASHIEQLAAHGTTFTRAYAPASVCAPSRYACLTGGNCHRAREQWGQWKYPAPTDILPGQRTLGALLQTAGYSTAYVGKWHLGGGVGARPRGAAERAPGGPLAFGFNSSLTMPRGIQAPPYVLQLDDKDRWPQSDPLQAGEPIPALLPCGAGRGAARLGKAAWVSQTGPCLAHHASALLRRLPEPFFLYYASQAAHAPFEPPANFGGGLGPVAGGTRLGAQGDMVREFDLAVGALVQALEARAVLGRTIVVVTSDNGGACMLPRAGRVRAEHCSPLLGDPEGAHRPMAGLRGFKGTPWEGGVRVPLVVRWGGANGEPHRTPPDTLSSEVVSLVDLVKSLALAAGARLGEADAPDALDLRQVLLGGAGAAARTARSQRRALAALASGAASTPSRSDLSSAGRAQATSTSRASGLRRTAMLLQSGGSHGFYLMLYVGGYKWVAKAPANKGACRGHYAEKPLMLELCMRQLAPRWLAHLPTDPLEARNLRGQPGHPTDAQLLSLLARMLRRAETHSTAALPVAQLLSTVSVKARRRRDVDGRNAIRLATHLPGLHGQA